MLGVEFKKQPCHGSRIVCFYRGDELGVHRLGLITVARTRIHGCARVTALLKLARWRI